MWCLQSFSHPPHRRADAPAGRTPLLPPHRRPDVPAGREDVRRAVLEVVLGQRHILGKCRKGCAGQAGRQAAEQELDVPYLLSSRPSELAEGSPPPPLTDLGLDHPELGEVAGRVRVLRLRRGTGGSIMRCGRAIGGARRTMGGQGGQAAWAHTEGRPEGVHVGHGRRVRLDLRAPQGRGGCVGRWGGGRHVTERACSCPDTVSIVGRPKKSRL